MAHKKQFKKTHSESGRSLLEMLGTLAIMAIISAGGIIGYSAAMRKHDANDLVHRLMVRAMDASTQAMTGQVPDLSSWPNDGKYTISPTVGTTATTFTLTVQDVPTDICEQINSLQWPLATITPEAGSCWESADMTFTFNKDLKPRSAGSGSGGNEGGEEVGEETDACTPYEGDPCIASCSVVNEQVSLTYAEGATCGTNMVCDDSGTCGCAENYTLNESTNQCEAPCPSSRQCGETCCGEASICVDGLCCDGARPNAYYACCDPSESTGYGYDPLLGDNTCCTLDQTTYQTSSISTRCCPKTNFYSGIGPHGVSICCDHSPEPDPSQGGMTCWTPNSNCKTNADCSKFGNNYFCNLKNETNQSCYYPTSGTCQQITTTHYTDTTVDGLGSIRISNTKMTWWAANNWCKAQGMNLVEASQLGCYDGGKTLITTGHTASSLIAENCRSEGGGSFSQAALSLNDQFGYHTEFWTATSISETDYCRAFFYGGLALNDWPHDAATNALCVLP